MIDIRHHLDDAQTDAHAALIDGHGGIALDEEIEHFGLALCIDARSAVADPDFGAPR